MKNAERMLIDCLKRYGDRRGIGVALLAHDWIAVMTRGAQRHLVIGYDLGLNGAAAAKIANDKGATFDVLRAAGLAAVEHRVFLHPRFLDFVPVDGNWADLLAAFDDFGRDAVVKDNEGTGGMEVFRVRSRSELEQRALALNQIARSLAIAPFLAITDETRFVMIEETCVLAYAKARAEVTGDGQHTVAELIAAARLNGRLRAGLAVYDNPLMPLGATPAAGTRVPLQWRHNLGLGAEARMLDAGAPELSMALALARQAMAALTLRFASIDVVTVNGAPMVLEANAGVMLEVASRPEFGGVALADRIYGQALDLVFTD